MGLFDKMVWWRQPVVWLVGGIAVLPLFGRLLPYHQRDDSGKSGCQQSPAYRGACGGARAPDGFDVVGVRCSCWRMPDGVLHPVGFALHYRCRESIALTPLHGAA